MPAKAPRSYGNAVDNALTAKAPRIEVPESSAVASTVPALGDGDPTTTAAYAVLSNQSGAGVVEGRASGGNAFATGETVTGNVDASSLTNDGNALVAAGYGNQSANSLDIDTVSIDRPTPDATGAVANVTGVQRLGDTARIIATTVPSAITHVFGNATGSTLSVSGNSDQTIATGNLASGNVLSVKANKIDARQGNVLGGGAVGTALSSPSGDASVTAAFSLQNVQDYGKANIFASSVGNAAGLEVGGAVSGSTINDDGNTSTVAATGNSARNAASLDATSIATSADLNNRQTGDGSVTATLGSGERRAGATLSALGPVTGSTLSVTNNQTVGTATGNSSANSLAVAADTLRDGSGHSDAEAGPVANGYGAAAAFALANEQKTGEPSNDGSTTPAIAATVTGRFAANGDAWADHSSLAVGDSLQHAGATANDSVNRLSIAATQSGNPGALPAGAALSSSQYGQANVTARSDQKLVALGATDGSSVSLARNTNEAVATINQADNGLAIDGIQIGSLTGTDAAVATGPLGPPYASGDHVLANQQFATGSASATAVTRIFNGEVAGGVDASQFAIANNMTSADSAANRALNTVSVTSAAGPVSSAGLVNTQINAANTTASATTNAAFSETGATLAPAVADGMVSIDGNQTAAFARGNVADNQLSLTGTGTLSGTAADVAVGPFDASSHAAGALLNSQASYGAVTASASTTGYGTMLNGSGTVNGSTLGITGNSMAAAAYGNTATNAVNVSSLGHLPTAALNNVQNNSGAVAAQVIGGNYNIASGALRSSALSVAGNQLAATAVGNQASSTIATTR